MTKATSTHNVGAPASGAMTRVLHPSTRETIMHIRFYLSALSALLTLVACSSEAPQIASDNTTEAQPSPEAQLNELNVAYTGNSIRAKREWGGRIVTAGGKVLSAGKNPNGTSSVLIGAGTPTVGEFVFAPEHEDFVARINADDLVTATCTVDPAYEGVSGVKLIACNPGTIAAAS